MRNLSFLLILLLATPLFGQTVQYGKTVEMEELGVSLAGVTLTIPSEHDCQPTLSDSQGRFRLCFSDHRIGDVIHNITARKLGYEVVNVHVTRSWTLTSADTLVIVMAPVNKMKEAGRIIMSWPACCLRRCFGSTATVSSKWSRPCLPSISVALATV